MKSIPLSNNLFYCLATFYNNNLSSDPDFKKNRILWNRLFSARLDSSQKEYLIINNLVNADELIELTILELDDLIAVLKTKTKLSEFQLNVIKNIKNFPEPAMFCVNIDFNITNLNLDGFIFPFLVYFSKCIFPDYTSFSGAIFLDRAQFEENKYKNLHFSKAVFLGNVFFRKSVFDGEVYFLQTVFQRRCIFDNSEFNKLLNFNESLFKIYPPTFFEVKICDNIILSKKKEPLPTTATKNEASHFIRSYEVLKKEMEKQKRIIDEHRFFVAGMRSRSFQLSLSKALPYKIYDFLSDYGVSIKKPLYGILSVWLFGFLIYSFFKCDISFGAVFSFASTFDFLGFRKIFFETELKDLNLYLKFLSMAQTISSAVFLFLLGLALKNTFRLR